MRSDFHSALISTGMPKTALHPRSACPRSSAVYDDPVTRAALIVLALALSSGCGTDPQGDDTSVDAVPHAGMTIDVLPMCQDHTLLARYPDGRQSRTTRRLALVSGIAPGSLFLVQRCGLRVQPAASACPSGATCTGSADLPGARCFDAYRVGEFVDGALMVDCGSRSESFNASGSPDGFLDISYASVKVTTF